MKHPVKMILDVIPETNVLYVAQICPLSFWERTVYFARKALEAKRENIPSSNLDVHSRHIFVVQMTKKRVEELTKLLKKEKLPFGSILREFDAVGFSSPYREDE